MKDNCIMTAKCTYQSLQVQYVSHLVVSGSVRHWSIFSCDLVTYFVHVLILSIYGTVTHTVNNYWQDNAVQLSTPVFDMHSELTASNTKSLSV